MCDIKLQQDIESLYNGYISDLEEDYCHEHLDDNDDDDELLDDLDDSFVDIDAWIAGLAHNQIGNKGDLRYDFRRSQGFM